MVERRPSESGIYFMEGYVTVRSLMIFLAVAEPACFKLALFTLSLGPGAQLFGLCHSVERCVPVCLLALFIALPGFAGTVQIYHPV